VSFKNVHGVEGNAAVILLVKFVKSGNLPPEWRSGVAAEDQHHRLLRGKGRELDPSALVLLYQRKIGRRIADLEISGAGVSPQGFEGKEQKRHRPRHFGHHFPESSGGWRMDHQVGKAESRNQWLVSKKLRVPK